jgi:GTA TIM-barrel-like domain/Putative phage tail protein
MTTIVLQTVGSVIGGALGGPIGAAIGGAVGALAGNVIDQRLFGKSRRAVGPRMDDLRVQSSQEGAAIPVVFGRARISGQVIWATNLEEITETTTQKASAKGSAPKHSTTEYKYFANFAVGLCEAEIGSIGRVWADGKPIDLGRFTTRLYRGTETQLADSLISAVEGADVPAYRGLAYIVFERLPLAEFGNRIPQLSFEVVRNGNTVAANIRALTIIPGATEFGYDTVAVTRDAGGGATVSENAHMAEERTDFSVSMDQAQSACRNLQMASLVVTWFGNDLRCGTCQIRPGVEIANKVTTPASWVVGGVARAGAHVVSSVSGKPAFGGTPSDASVIRAIQDMHARGLQVMFYPFVMMDVPAGNVLPNPYGGVGQPAYPWRGRITSSVAPGLPSTVDKTAAAATQVASFVGAATPAQFAAAGTTVNYSGPAEWSYRRMVLHYAELCALAGGVEAFLIGSELRGLTGLRSAVGVFPFVNALVTLAAEVKAILPAAKISYAADWSEYFGHHPGDSTGDVYFHLDPLWASPSVSFVGIDNYLPLADWRDGRQHTDYLAGWREPHDVDYLKANIAGGEKFDWFYASDAARASQTRTAISDGAYGKPWVFRAKDFKSWWLNQHFNRPLGVQSATATAWVPQSKPIWFTETGCPAIDKGANAPNVFYDVNSSESALPPFSSGAQDNLAQLRFVRAVQEHWQGAGTHNPVSSVYGTPMVDGARIFLWAWDARPYPAFPLLTDVWADGGNHARGHWLNGRIEALDLADVITEVCARHGLFEVDTNRVQVGLTGFVIDRPMSGRAALEEILELFAIDAIESGGVVKFRSRAAAESLSIANGSMVEPADQRKSIAEVMRLQETDVPGALRILYVEEALDFGSAAVTRARVGSASKRENAIAIAAAIGAHEAQARADALLEEYWNGRERLGVALPPSLLRVEAGDVLRRDDGSLWHVRRVNDGAARGVEAVSFDYATYDAPVLAGRAGRYSGQVIAGAPLFRILDLATTRGGADAGPWIAAHAAPWPGELNLFEQNASGVYEFNRSVEQRATIGETLSALPSGLLGRFDYRATLDVKLFNGALQSATASAVLNGANAFAVGNAANGYELLQFTTATLIGASTYRLSGLLRAQDGSLAEMLSSRAAGQDFILLNGAVLPARLSLAEALIAQSWKCGPARLDPSHPNYVASNVAATSRSLRCLSPAHLVGWRAAGDVIFRWVRRTRFDGDSWDAVDVPLGEERENYLIEILDGAVVKRTAQVSTAAYIYNAADIAADFGSAPSSFTVRVAQLSAVTGAGTFTQRTINA